MRGWRLLPLFLLAACGGPSLLDVEQSCGANSRPFVESWGCVKTGAAGLPGAPDLKRAYFAQGDLVAERIRAGQMTDAEGRAVMAETLSRLVSAQASRDGGGGYRPVTYQRTGPGTVVAY